jgi:hypothetical protein
MTISEAVECLQNLDSDDEDGEIVDNIFIQPPPGECADSDADDGEERMVLIIEKPTAKF